MREGFLIGKFLKAHTSAYKYSKSNGPSQPTFHPKVLANRLDKRAQRFHKRGKYYALSLQIGFAAAFLLVISAFQLPIKVEPFAAFTSAQQEVVSMEEIIQTEHITTPPAPPRPPVPVVVPDDVLIEADDLNLDASLDIAEPLQVPLPPPPPPEEEEVEEDPFETEVFVAVEQMPEMIGGIEAMMKDVVYPKMAQQAGMEGTVVVTVIIDQDGNPTNPTVLKSVGSILDEAAVEAVMKQKFEPGRQRNRPVRVTMSFPVTFRLRS